MEASDAIVFRVLSVVALVLMNAFFVAAEIALVKIRETQLETLVAKGQHRAKVALGLVRNIDATISTLQLGITLASLGMGFLVEPVFAALLAPVFSWFGVESPVVRQTVSIIVGFLTNSYLLIVVGELAPKAIAIRKTLPVALWTAQPLVWFSRLASPFIWVLNHSSQWFLARLGIADSGGKEHSHSEEELRLMFVASQRHAEGSRLGRDIVLNALDLRQRVVREVMRPRRELVGLNTGASIAECLDVAEKTRYSRFPLCEDGDIDRTPGVVHIKDLYAMRIKARTGADLIPVCRKLIYIPETARLERLLQLFLERRLHLAIVVDEFGGTVGMVTLENILEEIVGQIQDEFDQEKPLQVKVDDHTWTVDGSLALHDLSDLVQEPVAGDGVTTVSGWVTQRLGGFAKVGDTVQLTGFDLVVESLDGLRVSRLKLTRRGGK